MKKNEGEWGGDGFGRERKREGKRGWSEGGEMIVE